MKKQVIAYVHSHWDREWYREYEIFRIRLVKVFDNVLEMLEKNLLPSFYFDGQTAALMDYLEIRPEKEKQIRDFIKDKKLFIGPFYCLVDEYLTDENCFRKNLEIGLKISKDFGCEDFVGYFADTFGHSASTIPILKDYNINNTIVWRGVGDVPSEFCWNGMDTINLVRGYFNDVFSTSWDFEKKAKFLKSNLDKISEKSGDIILLPIGADHLGVEKDLNIQITAINNLLDDYEIKIGSIFEYIDKVKNKFNLCKVEGELRDNSKTFILEGCYSARIDLKRYNAFASYKLNLINNLIKYFEKDEYLSLIEYAYKLLLQNQAHDSICGCSTDDVHQENIIRYKKILQITDTILEDIRFENEYKFDKIINLSNTKYSGLIEFETDKILSFDIFNTKKGFPKNILQNTQKIPVTEDYTKIFNYGFYQKNIEQGENKTEPDKENSDIFITDNCIGNSNIFLIVENNQIRIGDKIIKFVDYKDEGDSYNTGYIFDDIGINGEILSSKIILDNELRSILNISVKLDNDILDIKAGLDKYSTHIDFEITWNNTKKNHLTEFIIDTLKPINSTFSEDFNNIIKRDFENNYNVREHLPTEKGIEVKTNTAPMHRGVCTNGIGIVTTGLNQYEIYKTELRIPILRATGIISNPHNPARTTPAGPPIETIHSQMIGINKVNFSVFLGNDLKKEINYIYNNCVII